MAEDIKKDLPEEEEMDADIITLVDEEGKEHEFEIIDSLDIKENHYLALIPTETAENVAEDEGELVILKVIEEDDEEFLEPIEDEKEFNEISEIFMDRLEEYYEFDEDEED